MHIVVGSGHAGIACAVKLVEAGVTVKLIDGGGHLEQATQFRVAAMASLDKKAWSEEQRAFVKGNVSASAKGIQVKKVFGSDFPFRDVDTVSPRRSSYIGHLTPSLAIGGFSNVWGAAALPFSAQDLKGWPVTAAELEPHYASVTSFMKLSGQHDDLEELFPSPKEEFSVLEPSRQGKRILAALQKRRTKIRENGFVFGTPRLAVKGNPRNSTENTTGCSYCGLCLFGCPYGHIYSTNDTLAYLKTFSNFEHVPGIVIEKMEESGGRVTLSGYARLDGSPVSYGASKVFLAAGILGTAKILMKSLEMYNTPVKLKVSEYFMLPLLSIIGTRGVQAEELHTLSQVFLECVSKDIGEHSAHMQLYTYSELFKLGLGETFGPLKPLLPLFESSILGRLHVIQGYLHSDVSSSIEITLNSEDGRDVLHLNGVTNPVAAETIKKLVWKLTKTLLPIGLMPVRPMLNIGLPGEGRHAGGSFPMRENPSRGECDLFGRPHGFEHVHVVDASVYPSVPASTITLTAMANAQRIATHVLSLSGAVPMARCS